MLKKNTTAKIYRNYTTIPISHQECALAEVLSAQKTGAADALFVLENFKQ
jgi:hypothetical protein